MKSTVMPESAAMAEARELCGLMQTTPCHIFDLAAWMLFRDLAIDPFAVESLFGMRGLPIRDYSLKQVVRRYYGSRAEELMAKFIDVVHVEEDRK